jgi:hypothetical protein
MISSAAAVNLQGLPTAADFRRRVAPGFRRREPMDPRKWLPRFVRFPDGYETTRFDFDDQPHVLGVIELFVLDPSKRFCDLCWSVRSGKTSLLTQLAAWKASEDPVPMAALFDSNDALANIDDHLYPLLESIQGIKEHLPPLHRRNRRVVRLGNCRLRLASAGKKGSVSGYPARWIFKFEREKIQENEGVREGDVSLRMDSRAAGFDSDVKIMAEGTPALAEFSNHHKLMQSPDVQRFRRFVPCPHCGKFQQLDHKRLRWNKNEHGKSEPALARASAWYECPAGCRIDNHQRRRMMQGGKWVAEGQTIRKDGRIVGRPAIESSHVFFGPLSKLYSLLIGGWGDIAAELVAAVHAFNLGNDKLLAAFYCETLAIPYEPRTRTVRAPELVERLRTDDHDERGRLPDWTSFLTFTADVGQIAATEELVFYWLVCAWGRGARGGVVDWGTFQPKAELLANWPRMAYPFGGQLVPVYGQPAGFDSGTFTAEVTELATNFPETFPLKGSSNSTNTVDLFWPGFQRQGLTPREIARKKKRKQYDLLFVNSELTQQWRQALTEGRIEYGDPGFVSLPADVCDNWEDHEAFLSELVEDHKVKNKWVGDANEFGDALRYGRALAEMHTDSGKRWEKLQTITGRGSGSRYFQRVAGDDERAPAARPFVDGFK